MSKRLFNARATTDDVLRDVELSGRVALVTGSNSGIGFETARSLAKAGAHVLLACRTLAKAELAAEQIRVSAPRAELTSCVLDLASLQSIRTCAATIPVARLDMLICNAGLYSPHYGETMDGFEQTLGVCHFGHFALLLGLLPRLRAAAPARVVYVSSRIHRLTRRLRVEDVPPTRARYSGVYAYSQAKLCNILVANELSRRWGCDGIDGSSLHPGGLISTGLARSSFGARLGFAAMRPWVKSVAQGAATTVYCATAPELEGRGGRYYSHCREQQPSAAARDAEAARSLWDASLARVRAASDLCDAGLSHPLTNAS